MEFSEKLRTLRAQRGMTQEELAAVAGVSRNAVSKWENGRGYPNWESLKRISREFGVTVDELIGGEELRCLSLENHSLLKQNEALLQGLLTFALYLAVGLLLPMVLLRADPTAPMAYGLVIGPVSFLLLGLLLGLTVRRWGAALLGGALAVGPIMIWYESANKMVVGGLELLFYALFAGSLLLTFFLRSRRQRRP
ncbi:MAG: helix-turn-helix domain-containing protein [Oscillospiraceae bacterium]